MALTKAERLFISDGIAVGMPKPFITSIIWMARKLDIEPKYFELSSLATEIDDWVLGGPKEHRE